MRQFWKRGRTGILVVAAALLGGLSSQALAGSGFTDIGSSPFQQEINRVAGAGIATGFPGGTFRPRDAVTRQQFAAWTQRSAGRAGLGTGFVTVDGNDGWVPVTGADTAVAAGAVTGNGGFVLVNVSADPVTTDLGHCPCSISVRVNNSFEQSDIATTMLPNLGDSSTTSRGNIGLTWVFAIPPGVTDNYTVEANTADPDVNGILVHARITALYVPFSEDGDNFLNFP